MSFKLKPTNIIYSFKILTGNTRVSVIFEPLWGIPFALYSFYLSLYMKSQGITDTQIGYLICIGSITGVLFSACSGIITDALGRKKTTLIFDLIAWPVTIFIYLFSRNFWMFALAQITNSMVRIVAVSWNLMVVEDADPEQQVAAYNLINTINISVGIFTPLAGLMVKTLGIVTGERILLGFAIVSMIAMMLGRNYYYRETQVGDEVLHEYKSRRKTVRLKLDLSIFKPVKGKTSVLMILVLSILFNAYIPIGTFYSLYYAPFLTETLKLDKSTIAILGGVNAGVLLLVLVFLVPLFSRLNRWRITAAGIFIQISVLVLFITIPSGRFGITLLSVILFAIGFGLAKPFIDAALAGVTGGKERTGIYAVYYTTVSLISAVMGFLSGYLFDLNPALIYIVSIGILTVCLVILLKMRNGGGLNELKIAG